MPYFLISCNLHKTQKCRLWRTDDTLATAELLLVRFYNVTTAIPKHP